MRLRSLLPLVPLLLVAACASSTTNVEAGGSPGPTTNPDPNAETDPLDSAPEGEPQCTSTGWCWESPYVPSTIHALHRATAKEGAPANPVWAVGDDGTILRSRSRGDAWLKMVVPTTKHLLGVFALDRASRSPTGEKRKAWAVGTEGTVVAFDGKAWSTVDLGLGLGSSTTFTGVWAAAEDDVWLVGHLDEKVKGNIQRVGILVHGDGKTWTRDASAHLPLYAVTGTNANNVWIGGGGTGLDSFDSGETELSHYDGKTWTRDESSGSTGVVAGLVVMPDSTDLARHAYATTNTPSSGANHILHYDGSRWKSEYQTRDQQLGAMTLDAWGEPMAIGPHLVARSEGKWRVESKDGMAGVNAVWPVDQERTLVAGEFGMLAPLAAPRLGDTMPRQSMPGGHYAFANGLFSFANGRWSFLKAPEARNERSATFSFGVGQDPNALLLIAQVAASDTNGYTEAYTWDGKRSDMYALPVGRGFYDPRHVARTKSGHTWFTGGSATVIHHGSNGAPLSVPTCSNRPMSAANLWAIGDDIFTSGTAYGTIDHVDAQGTCTTIKPLESSGFAHLESIDGTSPTDVWMLVNTTEQPAGDSTPTTQTHTVFRFDGVTVRAVGKVAVPSADAPHDSTLHIRVTGKDDAWVVGAKRVFHWSGTSFEAVSLGISSEVKFADVWKNGSEVRLVASGGRVLKKQ